MSCLPCALALVLVVATHSAAIADPDPDPRHAQPRLRGATESAQRLLKEAARRSPSIRELISRVEDSDLYVYVQLSGSPQLKTGNTMFVASTPHGRYLRIHLSASLSAWSRIHLLGHELQHALEIAADPSVTSEAALRDLYRRIGHSGDGEDQFETLEARRVELQVRSELMRSGIRER